MIKLLIGIVNSGMGVSSAKWQWICAIYNHWNFTFLKGYQCFFSDLQTLKIFVDPGFVQKDQY
jgi:hypothetical protein